MTRRLKRLLVVLSLFWPACAASPSPSQQAVIAEYEGRQLACVAEAGTRQESDECRCAVRAQFHRDCDGGRP